MSTTLIPSADISKNNALMKDLRAGANNGKGGCPLN
jgi:hypothetical protein